MVLSLIHLTFFKLFFELQLFQILFFYNIKLKVILTRFNSMNIQDFKGISYFRFLIPAIYIASWISMFIGPALFPFIYRSFCFACGLFTCVKAAYQIIQNIILILQGNLSLKRLQKKPNNPNHSYGQLTKQIYHAFAIPSYKEDIELLAQTLSVLASHKRAKDSYLIFLAMEKHEQDSHKKALELVARFKGKFRHIDYTVHSIRQYQQKGKASNVSWCAQKIEEKLKVIMIDEQDVILTVMDADSWAPNLYFDQMQEHLSKNFDKRHNFIYQPTQVYTRNNLEVPIVVRAYDDMFSSLHAANQISCSGITISFSNYSLSYSLVKKIGYWDTVEQAIAEDYHMCLKAHFKTEGKVQMVPIFVPFNQLCVQTGNGWIQDFKAKYWQIQRHSRVVAEIGYSILMLFRNKFSFKSIYVVFTIIEMILMPIIIPWTCFSFIVHENFFPSGQQYKILTVEIYMFVFNLTNALAFTSSLMYEFYKRRCSKALYGIQNPSVIRYLQAPILYAFNILVMMTSTYILGSFGNLKKNREYKVGEKKCVTVKSSQELMSVKTQQQKSLTSQQQIQT